MHQFNAFTLKADNLLSTLITEVSISSSIRKTNQLKQSDKKWKGLWDTGATKSSISQKIVDDLELIPTGQLKISTANGIITVNSYFVNILLPNGIIVRVMAPCSDLGSNIDLLLGMDIIKNGDFAITNVNGKTTFTFRIPSIQTIDYVAEYKNNNTLQ